MRTAVNTLLELGQLPSSGRTITLGDGFMLSDNLDDSEAIDVLNYQHSDSTLIGTPFKLRFTMVLLCVSGYMKLRLQMKEYEMHAGDLVVTVEGSIAECLGIGPDTRLVMLAFSGGFKIIEQGAKPSAGTISRLTRHSFFSLSPSEQSTVISVYNMLRDRLSDPSFQAGQELAISGMRTLFCYLSPHFTDDESDGRTTASRRQEILDRFLSLVENNSITERRLEFYAGKLCITPRYLSRVILETSGKPARYWINLRVILEAKVMLKEGTMSIQQISDRLNFPNQSFFGTFFKKATGISPSHYRNN